MKGIVIKCPNFGAKVKYHKKDHVITCDYCQTDIIIEKTQDEKINEQNLRIIDNCLTSARRFYADEEYKEAYKKYDRILELDSQNYKAIFGRGICFRSKLII